MPRPMPRASRCTSSTATGRRKTSCWRALQSDRDRRFASASELETELAAVLGTTGISRARQDLGGLVRRVFDDELSIDAEDETPAAAMPTVVAVPTSRRTRVWRRRWPF